MQLQSTTWSHCAQKGCFNFAAAGSCIPYCTAVGSFETIFYVVRFWPPTPSERHTFNYKKEGNSHSAHSFLNIKTYFIFGALCPSKSGLMNKHIVKT